MKLDAPHMSELTTREHEDILSIWSNDWNAARRFKTSREDQALRDYELYMRQAHESEEARRERNDQDSGNPPDYGSKLRSPMVYWAVETLLPRLAAQPPTVTVDAMSTAAIPYALAKQYRLQYFIRTGSWHARMIRAIRQMLVLGDAPVKVPFLKERGRPEMIYVSWWDIFVSSEAEDFESAERIWHRTYYTEEQRAALAEWKDGNGRPMFANLDQIPLSSREQADPTFGRRRELAGDDQTNENPRQNLYCVLESWSHDGTLVTLGGDDGQVLLGARQSPYKNHKGAPFRPFANFQFSPSIVGPWSLSLPQLIGHHQIELETLRNAHMDQISGNLHSPIVHMSSIPGHLVDEGFSRPNGRIPVDAGRFNSVHEAVTRMPPGSASDDFLQANNDVRSEVQLVAGISDIMSGQSTPGGIDPETATGANLLAQETNKRIAIVGIQLELEMTRVARMIDAHDRAYGGELMIPIPANLEVADRTPGIVKAGPVMRSLPHVNTRDKEYVIEVKAGSLTQPDQMEESRRLQQFVAMASHPNIAQHVDWAAVTREIAYSMGLGESVILTPLEALEQAARQQEMASMVAQQNGPQSGPQGGPGPMPGAAQGPQGAMKPPAPTGPPAPPNVAGPQR